MHFRPAALAFAAIALTGAIAPQWSWQLPSGLAPPSVPADNPMSAAKVALGRRLFYDADLSIDGTMSCASCHVQRHAFADSNRTRPGVHGDPGRRNAPSLANVAWRRSLTWADPSMRRLETQAMTPLTGEHPVEMGMKGAEAELARRLALDACYRSLFAAAFPAPNGRIDFGTVTGALAAFQRTLVSANSNYDRWRRGEGSAMPTTAIAGERVFQTKCAACHGGSDLTDDRFHRVATGDVDPADRGLGETTGKAADDGKFRTPSLRNAAVSAPYFHDGATPTLRDAILRHRDLNLGENDIPPLVAFVEQLTDAAFLRDEQLAYPENACGKTL